MGVRHLNHRLVKIHRTYTVEEVASRLGVHRNTVREWLRLGLPTIDQRRPMLVHGISLVEFLQARRARNKRPCGPGTIYCVRCREPRVPAGKHVTYLPLTSDRGNLVGLCPVCNCRLFRRVSLTKLDPVIGELRVSMAEALQHIDESPQPSVNSDFRQDASDHA